MQQVYDGFKYAKFQNLSEKLGIFINEIEKDQATQAAL